MIYGLPVVRLVNSRSSQRKFVSSENFERVFLILLTLFSASQMEKLIKHLKKELLSTKESLRMTQDQLLSRMQNSRSWGDVRETSVPQGYEKLQGKTEACSRWVTVQIV